MSTEEHEAKGVPRSKLDRPQKPIAPTATPPKQTPPPVVSDADAALDAAWKEKLRLARRAGAPQDAPRPKDWRPGQ